MDGKELVLFQIVGLQRENWKQDFTLRDDLPIRVIKGDFTMYLSKSEAEELQFILQAALQELDRRSVEGWKP